ncbi:septum formation inhibitor Maf [Erysipelothrix sp. HDW6C]|uniref:Maf family protein n=1 Tax=Erysipelothrix sp. HDW6C TaxID=2714930 RepID=UPI00140E0AD9|nr:Maf family protein [Erysipelothrix sp. HDW6C]QIK69353.1 septum formation inhibitor Maf [Erysipelothrix sp. HDW6C]
MFKKLVLASQSPRRREIISILGQPFNVVSPIGDETLNESLSVREQIEDLALRKATSVINDYQDSIVLGSDTVVVLDGEVLGKPKDEADASAMLHRLSGRTHQVITGVALVSSDVTKVFSVLTDVTFFDLTDEEIRDYVETKEPLDKAGSYGIQGQGSLFVASIVGDYYTIMGLPISRVNQELKNTDW